MSDFVEKGKGEGDVLDSTPSRLDWFVPYDNSKIDASLRYLKSRPYASFKVKFCLNCKTAFEYSYCQSFRCTIVDYYEDFPSISCEKEVCPKCL